MPLRGLRQEDFFGREGELSHLMHTALGAGQGLSRSVVVSGPRGIGKTELLKQLFRRLFREQERIAPFYYAVNPAVLSGRDFSDDFLAQFLCQRIAFDGKDEALVSQRGASVETIRTLAQNRGGPWAVSLVDQYLLAARDPLNALRTALNAPHQSFLATGKPVVVMIDEFHLLKRLSRDGTPDPVLVSLFADPLSSSGLPNLVAGNDAEMQEITVLSGLERMTLHALGVSEASSFLAALLGARGVSAHGIPPEFVRHLAGNPFYLRTCALAPSLSNHPERLDFWRAYFREVTSGSLALFWSAVLKNSFPELGLRRTALEVAYKIFHADHVLAVDRIPKTLSVTTRDLGPLVEALHFAGFTRGEFGVFSPSEDPVLREVVEQLYLHTVLGRPLAELEREFLERVAGAARGGRSFMLVLPATRESELVAAKCVEQISRTLGAGEEAIGQIQMAVIEAVCGAVDQGAQADGRIYVAIDVSDDRIEVSVEGAEREFAVRDAARQAGGGDWGVRIMKRFTDSVRFETTASGTRVVLTKALGRGPEPDGNGGRNAAEQPPSRPEAPGPRHDLD